MQKSRKASFFAIGVAIFLALAEVLSFVFGHFISPEMFSNERRYFASVAEANYEKWRQSPWFDVDLGWNTPSVLTSESKRNCLKQDVHYTFQDEYRGIPLPGVPVIALFGDSYTFGDEIGDDATSAAALERLIGAPVLNYGVKAFGPEQSVLKFERLAAERPMPKVAVLIVMHENIRRVVNSFRPVLFSATDMRYGLKPYIAGEILKPAPRPRSYSEFLEEARRSFASDFWARPQFSFPYSVSLFRAATSNSFYINRIASRGRPPFSYDYETENPLRTALTTAINRWRASTLAQGVRPFVLFVPSNQRDDGVAAPYADRLNGMAGETFVFEFEDLSIDWKRYNLRASGACHPSRYGQQRIAEYIADNILTSPLLGAN